VGVGGGGGGGLTMCRAHSTYCGHLFFFYSDKWCAAEMSLFKDSDF